MEKEQAPENDVPRSTSVQRELSGVPGDDWPTCWCDLSPGYGHLWHPVACPSQPTAKAMVCNKAGCENEGLHGVNHMTLCPRCYGVLLEIGFTLEPPSIEHFPQEESY